MSDDERSTHNSVFSAAQRPNGPETNPTDPGRSDFGLDIPVELAPLPSRGLLYPVNSSLHGKEVVEIRAMTAREEDILTNRALLKKGTVITELIRSCLIDRSIDPTTLIAGDRNALMVAIRVTGYGQEYDAEIVCGNDECEVKAPRQFNLGALEIQRLSIEPVQPGQNLFEFKLPVSKKTVKFRFLTGRDEEESALMQERQKKAGLNNTNAVTTNLMHTLVSVDGVEDRTKIAKFVSMMPARDSLELRNYIKNNEPGIKMKQEVECPKCGHVEEVVIPINTQFLWPSAG